MYPHTNVVPEQTPPAPVWFRSPDSVSDTSASPVISEAFFCG